MSFKLKLITDKSWLVISDTDDNRIGLLTEIRDQYTLMIAGAKQQFLNKKEVNTFFNEDMFKSVIAPAVVEDAPKDFFINGYPVNFDNPHEVIIAGKTLPLFSKKSTSDVYYCAGFFCIYFPKNIVSVLCPKMSTLDRYQFEGPFKTELEMKMELGRLRKLRNKPGSPLMC